MGFLSKITKPFKKIWKGIKKITKKSWKATKKFVKSKIGKLIIAAVVIYFTAGAGAAWLAGSGAAAGAGAAAGTTVAGGAAGTAAAGTAAAGTAAAGTAAAGTAAAGTAAAGTAAAGTAAAGTAAAGTAAAGTAAAGTAAAGTAAAGTAAAGTAGGIGGALSTAGSWMAANPMATMIGGQMLSSAMAPSEADQYEEMMKARRRGSNIAGVSGTGEGSPISLGLVQQAQQQDLQSPTYQYTPTTSTPTAGG